MHSIRPDRPGGLEAKDRGAISPANPKRGEWGYLVIWEFRVRAGNEKRFESVYASDGDWARFFRQDGSYIGTELVHGWKRERTYLTLDFWTSQEAYDEFRKRHLAKYNALDRKCEELTENEREIGKFARVPSGRGSRS
jgi:heme-degrading monooxygenase HmoA